mgnify:FL=1
MKYCIFYNNIYLLKKSYFSKKIQIMILKHLPERTKKIRKTGITMVMDKGLSPIEAEGLMEVASDLIDFVKLGFGTSIITQNLEKKIQIYKEAGVKVYFGGTLFEAFVIRKQFSDFIKWVKKYKIDTVEVSDGSIALEHEKKCEYISILAKDYLVLSEVGSKDESIIVRPNLWVKEMKDELDAGSTYVIGEARESGNVGIYTKSGNARVMLIEKIKKELPVDKIIFEAPQKNQQVYFIKEFGTNVNLGNVAYQDVIALETLRLGLRGDTFFDFLPENYEEYKQK